MANYADIPAANLCERHNLAYVDICPLCVTDDLIARRQERKRELRVVADHLQQRAAALAGPRGADFHKPIRVLDHGWVEIQADYLEHLLDLIGGD